MYNKYKHSEAYLCSFFVLSHELLVVWPLFDLSHFFLFALFFLFVLYHCNIQGPRAHQVISYQLISMGTYYGNTGCGVFKRGLQN